MFAMSCCYTSVRKQPLKILRPFAVEAEPNRCSYRTIKKIDAHRRVHTKYDVERPVTQFESYIIVGLTAFGFIEDDKLDVRYVCQEPSFGLADNPRNLRARPVILDAANDSQSMTCVAYRREANDTYFVSLCI